MKNDTENECHHHENELDLDSDCLLSLNNEEKR